ncbi:MAG: histidinol-phosphate transaminase [Cyclobacteriaceae bacterium]|jgi:histidinol-phosphate aminotransferase|nr:histidinol-phosphate transaminase [Cyclobacteriaceae bacterium]
MKSIDIHQLVRENVKRLKPYSSARDEFQGLGASVFLDANENPVATAYNRYPDPHQRELKKILAEIKGIPTDQIFLGNGSDEPIDLLFRAFCEPGKSNVVIPQPTYGMYAVSANINAVAIKSVLLTPGFDLDIRAIRQAVDSQTRMIFLCSPNNPTGNRLDGKKIETLLNEFAGLVVVDEAYIDFVEGPGLVPALSHHQNLVVLQTLSKAWGLASIRLGMCFAQAEVIAILNKIKPPYNISHLTQQTALSYLSDPQKKDRWVAMIRQERQRVARALSTLPLIQTVFPSEANFLLVRVDKPKAIYDQLVAAGIVVRDRSTVPLCEGCLRITIGTPAENDKVLATLQQLSE